MLNIKEEQLKLDRKFVNNINIFIIFIMICIIVTILIISCIDYNTTFSSNNCNKINTKCGGKKVVELKCPVDISINNTFYCIVCNGLLKSCNSDINSYKIMYSNAYKMLVYVCPMLSGFVIIYVFTWIYYLHWNTYKIQQIGMEEYIQLNENTLQNCNN